MPEQNRSNIIARWISWAPYLQSVLRFVVALMFMQHGAMKLFAYPAPAMPGGGAVPLFSQFGLAGILETFGGFLVLIGLFTRPMTFILSGEMAVAYFQFHASGGFWPILNRGEVVVLFCFTWLFFSMVGPGPWSLDALLRKRQ